MFYVEEISLDKAAGLLSACGLTKPQGVSCTAGVFVQKGKAAGGDVLAACASLKDDMIQGVAVDPAFQGEDLTGKLLTFLAGKARARGFRSLYLFTRPEKVSQFTGLGFRLVASARPYAALLEWGEAGVDAYRKKLAEIRRNAERKTGGRSGSSGVPAGRSGSPGVPAGSSGSSGVPAGSSENPDSPGRTAGALVMNCNPFTRGHRYLIEYAASRKDHVYILAVEEDISLFSFEDRLAMMKKGTADLANVTVISGGRYAVSTLTFPSYFTKEENLAKAHASIDAELFAACIAPPLEAGERFLGTEPRSKVTAVYNEVLKERLPRHGIKVTEIPRLTEGSDCGQVISASGVREVLKDLYEKEGTVCGLAGGRCAESLSALQSLLPESTLEYLLQEEVLQRLDSRLAEMMKNGEA